MDKPTLSNIITILLSAAIALAAVFGYNIAIVQPQIATLQPPATTPAARGITHFTALQAEDITATDDLTVTDAADIGGALSAASVSATGAVSGATLTASGLASSAGLNSSGPITSTTLAASGAITSATLTASGTVSGAGLSSTGSITATSGLTAAKLNVNDESGAGITIDSPYGQITIGDSQGANTGGYLMIDGSSDPAVAIVRSMAFQAQKLTVTAKTTSYTVDTVFDMGTWLSNLGAGGSVTFTLPAAAKGYNVCFYVAAAQTLLIDPDSTNQILGLTNAGGDRISNGSVGGSVCLLGLSSSQWAATLVTGTWTDAD